MRTDRQGQGKHPNGAMTQCSVTAASWVLYLFGKSACCRISGGSLLQMKGAGQFKEEERDLR